MMKPKIPITFVGVRPMQPLVSMQHLFEPFCRLRGYVTRPSWHHGARGRAQSIN